MADKRAARSLTFRFPPELDRELEAFVNREGWEKTEVVLTAVSHFLAALKPRERADALMRMRARNAGGPNKR